MGLAIGDKLGPYEILAPIGAGGMGEVWKARDARLHRTVAIKQISSSSGAHFQQEARAIAALNHPNICQIFDVGPDYLVLEFLEGTPLTGPLPMDEAQALALQIAGALEAAHKRGILHRDLKPSNVLVTESGAKLLDFGLARLTADSDSAVTMSTTGTVMGTAAYMAPEQAQGWATDSRSDIFSFGAVLYEMLSGRRAFDGGSMLATLNAVVRSEPAPLDSPLWSVVKRCLAKDPSQRFQSAAELKVALSTSLVRQERQNQPSIAVLPFINMSPDRENEYFGDGLAEEILNLLVKIPGLKVIARSSSFAFRGKDQDIRKIAEILGVSNVLEGSVRRVGSRLRVTAQLIQASDGAHLWSERYDRDLTDVFALQDEIGQAISEALKVRLAPPVKAVNIEAWRLCLQGEFYRQRLTPEGLQKGKEYMEQALTIDPNYAPAYDGLAAYYNTLVLLDLAPANETFPLARAAAEKALALNPANIVSHTRLGVIAAASDYDWKAADQHHRKAMSAEVIPSNSRSLYATYYLVPLGRIAEAEEQCQAGLEVDPLATLLHVGMAIALFSARQYGDAIAWARRGLEIDPNFYVLWAMLAEMQLVGGHNEEAIASLNRSVELAPWFNFGLGALAGACYRAGRKELSDKFVQRLAHSHSDSLGMAYYYAAKGDADAMFQALEGAYTRRDVFLFWINCWTYFDSYRRDPRYQNLLRKMNLATTSAAAL